MNLDQIISSGSRPWLPSHASDLDVWHADDVPVVGTFVLPAGPVLFAAVEGVDAQVTAWGYLPLSPTAYADLSARQYKSPVEMMEEVNELFRDQRFVVALAFDYRVNHWNSLLDPAPSLLDAAGEFATSVAQMLAAEVRSGIRHHDFRESPAHTVSNWRAALPAVEQAEFEETRSALEVLLPATL